MSQNQPLWHISRRGYGNPSSGILENKQAQAGTGVTSMRILLGWMFRRCHSTQMMRPIFIRGASFIIPTL